MVAVFLADGFEEIEAVAPADILRRAGAEVRLIGVGGRAVTGAHGIALAADEQAEALDPEAPEMIVLPGGMPGARNLEQSAAVRRCIGAAVRRGAWVAAICAAPFILGHMGLLRGRRAVCYPGYEPELAGAAVEAGPVCCDGRFITGNGPGAAFAFGLLLAEKLAGPQKAARLRSDMQMIGEGR